MRQLIKHFSWIALLMLGVQFARSWNGEGPIGNATDSWQVPTIGYGLGGDIVAPKDYGDGYRRNIPTLYYAYNASFLTYFGSNGPVSVDAAFAILNGVTNVDSYSSGLTEFPLETRHNNYEAAALGLVDLKSMTLSAMMEQMGLDDPIRYAWTLRDRYLPPGSACPSGEEYLVVQRNFGITTSPLNQFPYSDYVNDVLYSYFIEEACTGGNPLAETVPQSVDPEADTYSPVASQDFSYGDFYSGLTRDDVAGFRGLISTNIINRETAQPTLLTTNSTPFQEQLVTSDLALLLARAATNDPATLQALYPGLIFTTVTNGLGLVSVTNITAYYTNAPGATVTNFDTQNLLIVGGAGTVPTLDFNLFYMQALTNNTGLTPNSAQAIAQLQALYPGLVILSATPYLTTLYTTNYVTYLTNAVGSPYGSPPIVVTAVGSITANFAFYYNYTFGNLLLNKDNNYTHFYPFTSFTASSGLYNNSETVLITNTVVTNYIGSPYGSPLITNSTVSTVVMHNPGGTFFIMPTNWCGYTIYATLPPQPMTSYTNTVTTSVTNQYGTTMSTVTTVGIYTNLQMAVEVGDCMPVLVFATNVTSVVTNTGFQNTLLNIVTNVYSPTSLEVIVTTNIFTTNGAPVGVLTTNVTNPNFTNSLVALPSGDFFIVPQNWCGYTVTTLLTNVVATTNTTVLATATNGALVSQTLVTYFTNHTLLINATICTAQTQGGTVGLRQGIGRVQFVRANFDSLIGQFFQPITNYYTMVALTNSQYVTQYFQRIVATPDFTFSSGDLVPGPAAAPTYFTYSRNVNFDQGNILPGSAGPGVINSPTTITFDKAQPIFLNEASVPELDGSPYFTGFNPGDEYYALYFVWAQFDGTTNEPVIFPDGTSIANLESQAVVQITPGSPLPDGTNSVPYVFAYTNSSGTTYTNTFTATGGSFSPPFTWTATGLPPGLTMTTDVNGNGYLSGTPAVSPAPVPPGTTFDFTVQLTDSLGRSVQWPYIITIH